MKADTVIVGSISEVPVGKNCAVRGCENDVEAQENMEEKELVMHYPQQETESFPGSNVMISVEEEGKEFHHPTTATEKWGLGEQILKTKATEMPIVLVISSAVRSHECLIFSAAGRRAGGHGRTLVQVS